MSGNEILGGFYLGDRVEVWLKEHSIPHTRTGYIDSLDPKAFYPISVLLDEPLDGGGNWYSCSASELTRIAD